MTTRQISDLCQAIRHHTTNDRGASIVEYALLVTFIAAVCVLAITVVGTETASSISGVVEGL